MAWGLHRCFFRIPAPSLSLLKGIWGLTFPCSYRRAVSSAELCSGSQLHLGAFFFRNLRDCISPLRDACPRHRLSRSALLDKNAAFTSLCELFDSEALAVSVPSRRELRRDAWRSASPFSRLWVVTGTRAAPC